MGRKSLSVIQLLVVLLALFVVTLPRPAHADPQLVQKLSNQTVNAGLTISLTLNSVTAGNLIVVICATRSNETISLSAPSGMSTAINQAGAPSQAIFYKVAAGGETTVTCDSGTTARIGLHAYVYSGIVTSSPLHGTPGSTTGSSTAVGSGSTTTSTANTLLIAGLVTQSDTTYNDSWTNSFTEMNDFQNGGTNDATYGGGSRYVTSTGTYSTVATAGVTGAWRGQIAAFSVISPVLTLDIVNSSGVPVGSPSVSMSSVTESFACLTSTGTLGTSSQKIQVSNYTGTATWTVSIAATSGATALWSSGGNTYDFNDGAGTPAGCSDGADTDARGGQLTINPSGATNTPSAGCTTTGVTLGSSTAFTEGTTDSITLYNAGGTAGLNCLWDLTNVALVQTIPGEQADGTYTINLTLTITAS